MKIVTFKFSYFFFLLFLMMFTSCSLIKNTKTPILRLVDTYEIPYSKSFRGTQVGGLSGIDFDEKTNSFYIISDDRAEKANARVYKAKLYLNSSSKIDSLSFEDIIFLKSKEQVFFKNYRSNPSESVDPEDVRYYPRKEQLFWTSEGERLVSEKHNILQNPSIFITDLNGNYISEFKLPDNLKMQSIEKGPRRNGVLEGLSFNKNFTKLYTNVEEPLYEDGEKATSINKGIIRFFEFSTKTQKNAKQYFYQLDNVAKEPIPKDAFSVNGVSGFLNYTKHRFLVIERSYSTGYAACSVKIYDFNLHKAQKAENLSRPIKNNKKLVLNLDTLGIFTDNFEGISFGPKLVNGKQSILLISDNNFSEKQKMQLFLFELNK